VQRFVLALVLFLTLPFAVAAQEAPTTQPGSTIAVEGTADADARIATRIRAILTELDGYEDVTVTVSEGIVTLRGKALDMAAIDQLETLVTRVEGVVALRNQVSETTDLGERLTPAFDRFMSRLEQVIAYAPLLLVALGAAVGVWILGVFVARLKQPWNRIAPNPFIADVLRQFIRLAFALAAIVVALDILGATALLGTFLGAAGILGIALGFAVKDSVENFIASVMLSLRQPFRPNDLVEIDGDLGRVIRLTSRATILLSVDGNHIRIPNSTVFKARIVNFSENAERRFQFDLGVDAEADLARVRDVGLGALGGLGFVLDRPAPAVWVEGVGDSNVVIRFAAWVDQTKTDFALARGEAIRIVKCAVEAAGFGLPEPIYRVRLDQEQPTAPPPAATAPAERPVDARNSAELEAIVESERRDKGAPDLLNEAAPKE
jgi:small-conductance mechanosensitive channel